MVDECELPPPLQIGVHDLVAVPVIRSLIPISCSRHPLRSFNHRTRSTLVVGGRAMRANHYFQLLIHLFRKSIKEAFVHCLLLVTTRQSPLSSTTLSSTVHGDPKQSSVNKLISLRSLNCDHGCNDRRSGGIKFNSTGRYMHCFL